ncbi:MAG TPA: GGDEF domain-containing protein [Gammaproteobacteria bacterium]|nr:GGDEF domain-containing protein [Gammaproteobacteria bacterium]
MTTKPSTDTDLSLESGGSHTRLVLSRLCLLGIPVHAVLILVFGLLGIQVLAVFNIASTAAWILAWALLRRGDVKLASAILLVEILLHAIATAQVLGWEAGFQYYLIPTITLVIFLDVISDTFSVLLGVLVAVVFVVLMGTERSAGLGTGAETLTAMKHVNMGMTLVALIIISYYYRKSTVVSAHRLGEMARTDPLTGLLNRRGAYEMLEEYARLPGVHGGNLAIALADVDQFKALNDRCGHACGDRVLQETGRLLRKGLRNTDLIARWGGEEFLLVLPGSTAREAAAICEKLRIAIENSTIVHEGSDVSCTVTFGVADYQPGDEIEAAISSADKCLYEGKEAGRNRVVVRPASVDTE